MKAQSQIAHYYRFPPPSRATTPREKNGWTPSESLRARAIPHPPCRGVAASPGRCGRQYKRRTRRSQSFGPSRWTRAQQPDINLYTRRNINNVIMRAISRPDNSWSVAAITKKRQTARHGPSLGFGRMSVAPSWRDERELAVLRIRARLSSLCCLFKCRNAAVCSSDTPPMA